MDEKLNEDLFVRQEGIVHRVAKLPHKILQFHDVDGLAQMILHELSHKPIFNLKKATYLVDNPDFDHLIGVAGFCCAECHHHKEDLWQTPHSFVTDMENATFHNDVKKFLKNSLRRKDINLNDSEDIIGLAHFLGMQQPGYFSWNMKHGNHGVLIFDKGEQEFPDWKKQFLMNAAALLSFGPIF